MALLNGFLGKEKEIIDKFKDKIVTLNTLLERFVVSILTLISLTDEEFREYINHLRELRKVLKENLEVQ